MAGNYPDAPNYRLPYDADGTIILDGSLVEQSQGTKNDMNDENSSGLGRSNFVRIFMFPRLTQITHVSVGSSNYYPYLHGDYSLDTTTGGDGTWTAFTPVNFSSVAGNNRLDMRNAPGFLKPLAVPECKAVRINFNTAGGYYVDYWWIHLFGNFGATSNLDRLELWQPATDAAAGPAYFDWGDTRRLSSATKTFRVKNRSSTLTANTITVSRNALYDTSPTNVSQYQFSLDNVTFTDTVSLGNLAPGAISSVIYVKRITPTNAVLALWWTRIFATPASWT